MTRDVFDEMAAAWPSVIVARTEVERFTGGLMTSKYQANLDCLGQGPERIVLGRKIGYPVKAYVLWLRSRVKEG